MPTGEAELRTRDRTLSRAHLLPQSPQMPHLRQQQPSPRTGTQPFTYLGRALQIPEDWQPHRAGKRCGNSSHHLPGGGKQLSSVKGRDPQDCPLAHSNSRVTEVKAFPSRLCHLQFPPPGFSFTVMGPSANQRTFTS